uniref:Uncharacterized protein n=2 Tax=Guillardia theta TaxID=55529 RepID=A0A7S4JSP7_GUITH|mmetsp:Transcript_18383/g.60381  ORF Transcript_18383/g.60381 Transcript_18383/m.60381 type:complete len:369 (+) Transcript_18383:179-1285(+)
MPRSNGGKVARRAAEEEYAIFVPKDAREAKFSEQFTSQLDWQIYRSAQIPGPGSYIASNEYELPKGGTWSKFKTKGYCDDVIRKGKETPGPADYPSPKFPPTSGGRISRTRSKTVMDWIELRARDMPGPADIPTPALPKPSGGRFNVSNPKSDIDWLIYKAARLPGPSSYTLPPTPLPRGGAFNQGRSKTELDWIELRASKLPGPGQYDTRNREKLGGGRFNLSNPKSELDWTLYRTSQLPGPGYYEVSKSLDAMNRSPSCRILGRTGPKNLPWPYGGDRVRPERSSSSISSKGDDRTSEPRRRSVTSARALSSSLPLPTRPQLSSSKVSKSSSLASLAGYHPLAEDPASPLHRRKRQAKKHGTKKIR